MENQQISANLRRLGGGLDHKNPAHVRAYLLARQTSARPRADAVWAILNSQTDTMQQETKLQTDFFLVPKSGCVGKPTWLAQ